MLKGHPCQCNVGIVFMKILCRRIDPELIYRDTSMLRCSPLPDAALLPRVKSIEAIMSPESDHRVLVLKLTSQPWSALPPRLLKVAAVKEEIEKILWDYKTHAEGRLVAAAQDLTPEALRRPQSWLH